MGARIGERLHGRTRRKWDDKKWIFQKYNRKIWAGLVWLRIEISAGSW